MDIAVSGASGRIGRLLAEQILSGQTDRLAACFVSEGSAMRGRTVPGALLEYQTATNYSDPKADVLIDFSTPAASAALMGGDLEYADAYVIGTTGFSDPEWEQVLLASKCVPIFASANFASAFGLYVNLCKLLMAHYPGYSPTLEEIYHRGKKPDPSGTSRYLADILEKSRVAGGGDSAEPIPIHVMRHGATIGVHKFRLADIAEEYEISFSVLDRNAYAKGALKAARWVHGRAPGLYGPADMANTGEF